MLIASTVPPPSTPAGQLTRNEIMRDPAYDPLARGYKQGIVQVFRARA
jgi:hypothetical protein